MVGITSAPCIRASDHRMAMAYLSEAALGYLWVAPPEHAGKRTCALRRRHLVYQRRPWRLPARNKPCQASRSKPDHLHSAELAVRYLLRASGASQSDLPGRCATRQHSRQRRRLAAKPGSPHQRHPASHPLDQSTTAQPEVSAQVWMWAAQAWVAPWALRAVESGSAWLWVIPE